MKTLAKGILTALILIFTLSFTYGQKGVEDGTKYGHGQDSINCIKNLSLFREYAKQKNYDLALDPWTSVYTECPKASKYIYIDGIRMVEKKIKASEGEERKVLLDSMMNIYKKRIKYFSEKGKVLGYMGEDFFKYCEKTPEYVQIAYDYLTEAMELEKDKTSAPQLLAYMQASNILYKTGNLEAGIVVSDFGKVMEIAEYVVNNKKKGYKNMTKAIPSIEKIFEDGGAANCDDLVPYYANKFEETPEDVEFLKKSSTLLRTTKCTESDLYFDLIVKLNSLEPTSELAYEIAKMTNMAEKLDDATKYYLQAIELEADDILKAKYYLELGDVTRRKGDYPQARAYALKSIEFDATSGYPYLLIGNIYAASSKSCSEEEFEQKAVYWAAVDKFMKAKSVDPELTADANKFIEAYKPHFPDNETIFFYGLKSGDSYTVGCWINEKTSVRPR